MCFFFFFIIIIILERDSVNISRATVKIGHFDALRKAKEKKKHGRLFDHWRCAFGSRSNETWKFTIKRVMAFGPCVREDIFTWKLFSCAYLSSCSVVVLTRQQHTCCSIFSPLTRHHHSRNDIRGWGHRHFVITIWWKFCFFSFLFFFIAIWSYCFPFF